MLEKLHQVILQKRRTTIVAPSAALECKPQSPFRMGQNRWSRMDCFLSELLVQYKLIFAFLGYYWTNIWYHYQIVLVIVSSLCNRLIHKVSFFFNYHFKSQKTGFFKKKIKKKNQKTELNSGYKWFNLHELNTQGWRAPLGCRSQMRVQSSPAISFPKSPRQATAH